MDNIETRIARLEQTEAIRRLWMRFGEAMDTGGNTGETYGPEAMAQLSTNDGSLIVGDTKYEGIEEMRALWRDLAQTLSMHYMCNYLIDVDPAEAIAYGRWYVWETPVLSGRSVLGCFTLAHVYEKQDDGWLLADVMQRTHFFSPFPEGWVDGATSIEQRRSHGG